MQNKIIILPNSGILMPLIGLGTYARKAERGQYKQAALWALEAGYRHIDTATVYKNEQEIGEAIGEKIKEGLVTRDQLFVTTKLWNDRHLEADVVPALKESLTRLNLEYVDLYLVHWPVSINEKGEDTALDYLDTWKGMEKALELGLTKAIGVSNFNISQLDRLVNNVERKPDVNQFEFVDSPRWIHFPEDYGIDFLSRWYSTFRVRLGHGSWWFDGNKINPTLTQNELVNWCKEHSIVPVAYTPLGLVSEARPEFSHLAHIKTDPKLANVAEKYKKSIAQVCLRYLIQRGIPVIPKSFTKARIEENLNIFDFELDSEEMTLVESFNLNHHCVPSINYKNYNNYPF